MNQQALELVTLASKTQFILGGKGFIPLGWKDDYGNSNSGGMNSYIETLEGNEPFDYQGLVAVPGIGGNAVVLTFTVPQGYDGLITAVSHFYTGGGFVAGSGDLIWRYSIDGRPIKNYNNILFEFGDASNLRPINNLRIYSGQVITLTVLHINNPALGADIIGTIMGKFYPRKGN